jgi:hypothetical protein
MMFWYGNKDDNDVEWDARWDGNKDDCWMSSNNDNGCGGWDLNHDDEGGKYKW